MKAAKASTPVPPTRLEDLPDLLTPDECAAFLRISRNTMYSMLQKGTIPSLKYGRLFRIRKSVLL
jgi:excisionase family DNA binding protein